MPNARSGFHVPRPRRAWGGPRGARGPAVVLGLAAAVLSLACVPVAEGRTAAPGLQLLAGDAACVGSSAHMSCTPGGAVIDGQIASLAIAGDGRGLLATTQFGSTGFLRRDPATGRLNRQSCVSGGAYLRAGSPCRVPPVVRRRFRSIDGSGRALIPYGTFDPTGDWAAIDFSQYYPYEEPEQDAPDAVQLLRRDPASGAWEDAGCITPDGSAGCAAAPGMHHVSEVDVGRRAHRVIILSYGRHADALHWLFRDAATGRLVQRACLTLAGVPQPACPATISPAALGTGHMTADAHGRVWLVTAGGTLELVEPDLASGSGRRVVCYGTVASPDCPALAGVEGVDGLALTRDGRWLYATASVREGSPSPRIQRPPSRSESRVVGWAVGAGGELRYIGCHSISAARCGGPVRKMSPFANHGDLSVTGDGRELVVSGQGPWAAYGYLALFSRDQQTGTLISAGCLTSKWVRAVRGCGLTSDVIGDTYRARFAPDGRNVYISPFTESVVAAFGRGVAIDSPARRRRPRGLTVTLTCAAARTVACRGTLSARGFHGGAAIARTAYRVPAGRARAVRLRSGRSWCTARRPLRVTATDGAGVVRPTRALVDVRGC